MLNKTTDIKKRITLYIHLTVKRSWERFIENLLSQVSAWSSENLLSLLFVLRDY